VSSSVSGHLVCGGPPDKVALSEMPEGKFRVATVIKPGGPQDRVSDALTTSATLRAELGSKPTRRPRRSRSTCCAMEIEDVPLL
jgi:hypothetical protein